MKYLGDKYSDEERSKVEEQAREEKNKLAFIQAASGFGEALAGRAPSQSAQYFGGLRGEVDKNTIGKFDQGRKQALMDYDLKQKFQSDEMNQEKQKRMLDPNSIESQSYKQIGAKFGIPQAQLNQMNAAQIRDISPVFEKIYELDQKALDRRDAKEERRALFGMRREDQQIAKQEKQMEKDQALMTPFGLARTPDDAKQLKEAAETKQSFDDKISELIDLRKKAGGGAILDREAVARGKQLSKDLLLDYKTLAKLGVLSQSDFTILNAIIPDDPLQYRNPMEAAQGQDSILKNMEAFKADKEREFQNRLYTRLRPESRIDQQVPQAQETKSETVIVVDKNGKQRMIPSKYLQDAIKQGAKLVGQ